LRFRNPANPAVGGRIDMLLDGTEGPRMMDNITVSRGKVLIQEDIGNNAQIGKVWSYDIATDAIELIAQHDPDRFVAGAPGFLTQDEESSGIIPVSGILGRGWYLAVVQAHCAIGAELVEGGQVLALHVGAARDGDGRDDDDEDEDCGFDR
jgi:hypothetical protein